MTVSKTTTQERAEKFRPEQRGHYGVEELAEFADSISAELQTENARLKMVFEEAIILVEGSEYSKALKLMRREARECWQAVPPPGGAVQKWLSKEKAK